MEQVWFYFFLNPNQVQGGVGFCNNLTCLALPPLPFQNEIPSLPLTYKYLLLELSFQGSHSSLSLELSFLFIIRVVIPLTQRRNPSDNSCLSHNQIYWQSHQFTPLPFSPSEAYLLTSTNQYDFLLICFCFLSWNLGFFPEY